MVYSLVSSCGRNQFEDVLREVKGLGFKEQGSRGGSQMYDVSQLSALMEASVQVVGSRGQGFRVSGC